MISYQAIPASYKVAPLPITRNGGESIYGGELGEVVIIGHTGDDSGGGYGDGGYSGDGDGGYSGGGSGGGSSGGSNPPPQTPTPTTPCEFRSTMQADTSFNSNMLIYYEKSANDSLEDGYIKRTDGLLQLPTERNNKSLGYSALLHTHPIAAGGAPLFSAEDVYALNTMYKKGYIDNATNFRYIVASPYAIIVLQITDETKYAAFTNTYHNNLENLQNKWNESMTGNNVGEVDNMMRAFMTFLNSSNSGLSFIAGNVDENNVINWNVKEINNNTISNKECN
jgi:hypothetical protein